MDTTVYYALTALVALLALTVHEFSHGYAAYKLGDPTAKYQGRLTLNPLRHLDPIGAVCMILLKFGWAKPVPINPNYFKKRKRDFAITALAGPLSNLIFSFVAAFLYLLTYSLLKDVTFTSEILFNIAKNTILFFYLLHLLNINFAIFNLLPIPPFDGSRILYAILPERIYFKIMRYERQIYYVVLIWLVGGSLLSRGLMSLPFAQNNPVFEVIAEILSLSGIIGYVSQFISDGMIKFWELIPFLR